MREWVEAGLKENTINSADIAFANLALTLAVSDSNALWCASVLASAAVQNGDVCVTLTDVAEKAAEGDGTKIGAAVTEKSIRDALLSSGVVQTVDAAVTLPLVIDSADRLYLARYWQLERELAEMLLSLLNSLSGEPGSTPSAALLNDLFPPLLPLLPPPPPDWQRVAAVVAARQRLCVITGGPGTGKTRTVARFLAVLQAQATQPLRIALLAPTGKAAARLLESLRGEVSQLQQQGLSLEMPDVASTLHRALGYQPGRRGFKHNAGFLLPFDLVLVDEASMVDLSLMHALLSALDDHTRLVLLGDRDQLASVEAGNVLGDIIGNASPGHYSTDQREVLVNCCEGFDSVRCVASVGGIADAIVELQHSYRFDAKSGIGRFASAVNRGDATVAIEIGNDSSYADLSFINPVKTSLNEQLTQQAIPAALTVIDSETVSDALAASLSYRVLCALYHGPRGVESINRFIESRLVRRGHMQPNQLWYKGRPILVTRNDPGTGLYNGDTGLIWPDDSGHMMAWFADTENNNKVRPVAPGRLPAHQTCFAMTVHKTQGSEFTRVLLVLPEPPHTLLSRDLLYTGITRARSEAEIYGSEAAVRVGSETKRERASGLRDRLWG